MRSTPVIVITHAPHLTGPVVTLNAPIKASLPASIVTKGIRLLRALRQWQAAGLPLTPKPILERRRQACIGCDLYRPDGNFGLGECGAPGCGCTKFKAWLATEKCPHPQGSRWTE